MKPYVRGTVASVLAAGLAGVAFLAGCASPGTARDQSAIGEPAAGERASPQPTATGQAGQGAAPTPGQAAPARKTRERSEFYNCDSRIFAHDSRCYESGGPWPHPLRFPDE